jgi:hypothetical protein
VPEGLRRYPKGRRKTALSGKERNYHKNLEI